MVERAKKFTRLLLNSDTRVGRGSKPEVLTDELRQVEKHMEHVRTACQPVYKKLSQCVQTHGLGDYEKRQSRLPDHMLAQTMQDACKHLQNDNVPNHLFRDFFRISADVQEGLAKQKAFYESFVDDHVISPLQTLVETDIPGLIKQREKLERYVKAVQERENALTKAEKAHVHLQSTPNAPAASLQQAASKIDTLKEEHNEAIIRMQQYKDELVIGMFDYLINEMQHSQRIVDFHAKQLEYHRKCVEVLEKVEPEFQSVQEAAVVKQSFKKPLTEHLRNTKREIALPIEACVLYLLQFGLKEEGLFRIAGGAAKVRMVKTLLDGGVLDLHLYDVQDIHAVAGALKQFVRELPQPLLTRELYDEWMEAASVTDHNQKLQDIWTIISKLPAENKANFRYLMKFCEMVASHHEVNKMTTGNLALVLAPNLLRLDTDDMSESMKTSKNVGSIIDSVITYANYFFPEDIDFAVTPNGTSYYNTTDNQQLASTSEPEPTYANIEAVLSPPPLSPATRKKTHVRSSSSDRILSESTSTNHWKPTRKHKNKAPAPPPQPPQGNMRTHERTNSSPPIIRSTSDSKPPIAAKRSSTKKPQGPPPNPPKDDNSGDDLRSPPSTIRKPGSRPPIPEKRFQRDSPLLTKEEDIAAPLSPDEAPLPPPDWLTPGVSNDPPGNSVDEDGCHYTAL